MNPAGYRQTKWCLSAQFALEIAPDVIIGYHGYEHKLEFHRKMILSSKCMPKLPESFVQCSGRFYYYILSRRFIPIRNDFKAHLSRDKCKMETMCFFLFLFL